MGVVSSRHRPLMAGLQILAPGSRPGTRAYGTLTGLATRNSDGKRVLVTNLHVVSAGGDAARWTIAGGEKISQGGTDPADEIGLYLDHVPVSPGASSNADVAICSLLPGVDADFHMHNHPVQDSRLIVPGVIEPRVDNRLIMLGGISGERTLRVTDVDENISVGGQRFTGVVVLESRPDEIERGDSGSPCLVADPMGNYRMSCIIFAKSGNSAYAFPASVAESELRITFGDTSAGFVGRRWIVEDYFRAGHPLHAGDVVCIKNGATARDPNTVPGGSVRNALPRVYKIAGDDDKRRVIGIVYTPANKAVGDQMASSGEHVSIVVSGLAKALSSGSIEIGDPVIASGTTSTPAGKSAVATVVGSTNHNHSAGKDGKTGESDQEARPHTVTVDVGSANSDGELPVPGR